MEEVMQIAVRNDDPKISIWIKILISIILFLILGIICFLAYLFFSPSIQNQSQFNKIPVMCEIDDDTILKIPVICSISYVDKEGEIINSTCVIEPGAKENNYAGPHRCNPNVLIEKTEDKYPTITAGFLDLSGCIPEATKEENSYTIKCERNCANVDITLTNCTYSDGNVKVNFERNDFESSLKQMRFDFNLGNFSVMKETTSVSGNVANVELVEGKPIFVKASFLVEREEGLLLCGEVSNTINCV